MAAHAVKHAVTVKKKKQKDAVGVTAKLASNLLIWKQK